MSGKTQTISNETPRIGAVNIQQSSYGLTLPIVWGRTRITGNLIWYGDFTATPHTTVTQSGGKGGAGGIRQSDTKYDYSAAVMMALCEGPIQGVRSAWRGKYVYGGASVGTTTPKTTESRVAAASVTVTNAATWISDVSVEMQVSYSDDSVRPNWEELVNGVDYTVAAGVYSFVAGVVGKNVRITYTYSTAATSYDALGEIGLSLAKGTTPQTPWGYLTTKHPTQAVGYSGVSYVYASNYSLTGNAEVDNHSFEIDAQMQFSASIPDANPADIVPDFLANPVYGTGFGLENIGSTTDFRNSATAQGIFLSPALTEQAPAVNFLNDIGKITNIGYVWSEGLLKMIPYCDMPITGNGVTYTPNTTPIYDLTDEDFLPNGDSGPVKAVRRSQADAFNRVQVEFRNRANAYNVEIMEAKDQADIENSGVRSMPTVQAHAICDKDVARIVAQLLLQRSLYIRNRYEFKLGWNKILLEPMDLVTITDSGLGLNKQPVRIISMEEDSDGVLSFVAEEFPKGSASATLYPSVGGSGFAHDYNTPAGNAYAPVIFEAPASLTTSADDLEVWLATGGGALYGGCEVWVSLDGSTYQRAYDLSGSSRYGVTTSILGAQSAAGIYADSVGVSLTAGGQLLSGSSSDLNQLSTLCYVGGEFLAYETATLTGANAYTIGPNMSRGAYLSSTTSKASGVPFVRCDDAIAKMPLTKDYIGKTIYIKLLSYNYYKGAMQSLADVSYYSYTVTGAQANLPPIAPPNLALEGSFTIDTAKFKWDKVGNADTYNVQIWDTVGNLKKREVNVGRALRYDYSANDAKSDGGPWRQITIKVQGINPNGASGSFSTLTVNNSQVGALSNVKIASGFKSLVFSCDKPTDADFAGIQIWIGTTAGFTADASTLVYDGPNTSFTITALHSGAALTEGTNYYVKWAGYDTFDKNSLTVGASSALTTIASTANQVATAYLYQWKATTPSAPNGNSTFTWATGANSGYTGVDGWSVTAPANPGTAGMQLWVASVGVSGTGTTATITWATASPSISAWSQNGANGSPGIRTATISMYQMAASAPSTFPSGTSTYTWATGAFTNPATLNGWSATPPAPVAGQTLWETIAFYSDNGTSATSTITWPSSGQVALPNASSGANGSPGIRTATISMYQWAASAPSTFPSGTSTYTWATGAFTNPATLNGWSATPPAPVAGQTLWETVAFYSDSSTSSTSTITWPSTGQVALPNAAAGSDGSPGSPGTRTATISMYQWAASAPATFPSGTSTYTWATGAFTNPATTNGWSATPPAPVAGQTLWETVAFYSDNGTSATSTITWPSTGQVALSSAAAGTNGTRTATISMYQWAASTPTLFPSGSSTYTWATGAFTNPTTLNGWSATPPAPVAGQTLWETVAFYSDQGSSSTSTITWPSSGQVALPSTAAGTNGTRTATISMYQWAASAPTLFPSGNSTYTWATGAFTNPATLNGWSATPPAPVIGQTLWETVAFYSDQGSSATSVIAWPSSGQVALSSTASGANGARTATISMYQWAASAPTLFPSGTSTYTWATGAFTNPATLNGWSATPPAPVTGQTLWETVAFYSDNGTSATSTITWPSTGQVALSSSAAGSNGVRTATISMYQWAASAPSTFPSGTSTYTWATGAFTNPATLNGWSATPTSPVAGQTLWETVAFYSDSGTSATSTITWPSTGQVALPSAAAGANGSPGSPGSPGTRASVVGLYVWGWTTPSAPTGTTTYNWSTGAWTHASETNGWQAAVPVDFSVGKTLYYTEKAVVDATGSASTSTVTWSGATIVNLSSNGNQTLTCYSKYTGNGAVPSGTTTTQLGAYPSISSFGVSPNWGAAFTLSPPSLAAGETNWICDGYTDGTSISVSAGSFISGQTYTITSVGTTNFTAIGAASNTVGISFVATGAGSGTGTASAVKVTWKTPYIGTFKVGSLSAFSADLGTITAGNITLDANGYIRGGQTSYNTGTGFWFGFSGGAYKFSMGDSTQSITWDGSALTVKGNLQVGTAAVSGSTMTGSGAQLNSSGTFALGTGTITSGTTTGGNNGYDATGGNIVYNGTDIYFNGFMKAIGGDGISFKAPGSVSSTKGNFVRVAGTNSLIKVERVATTLLPAIYITDSAGASTEAVYISSDTSGTGTLYVKNSNTSGIGIYAESTGSSSGAAKFFNQGSLTSGVPKQLWAAPGLYSMYSPTNGGKYYVVDGVGPFTGVHDGLLSSAASAVQGDILVDKRLVLKSDIANTLFEVDVSTKKNQKGVIGVLNGTVPVQKMTPAILWRYHETTKILVETVKEHSLDEDGEDVCTEKTFSREIKEQDFVLLEGFDLEELQRCYVSAAINALGEGQINVCGEGGDINVGDLIVTSSLAGKGMKQDDDLIRSYTVAKAREAVKFASADEVKMIACVYVSG